MAKLIKILVVLWAAVATHASSQDSGLLNRLSDVWVDMHLNTRNPKIDSLPIDWWVGSTLRFTLDSSVKVSMKWSRERDQGQMYNAYRIRTTSDYVSLDRIYDQEKSMDIYTASLHIPAGNWKLGYGYIAGKDVNSNNFHVYYGRGDLISMEVMLFDGLHKLDIKFVPDIKIREWIFLTYEFKLMYVTDERWDVFDLSSIDGFYQSIKPDIKFSSGFTVKIKVK